MRLVSLIFLSSVAVLVNSQGKIDIVWKCPSEK